MDKKKWSAHFTDSSQLINASIITIIFGSKLMMLHAMKNVTNKNRWDLLLLLLCASCVHRMEQRNKSIPSTWKWNDSDLIFGINLMLDGCALCAVSCSVLVLVWEIMCIQHWRTIKKREGPPSKQDLVRLVIITKQIHDPNIVGETMVISLIWHVFSVVHLCGCRLSQTPIHSDVFTCGFCGFRWKQRTKKNNMRKSKKK